MAKAEKTNVMRLLDSKKVPYSMHYYGDTDAVSGTEVAAVLGEAPEKVFKTLVTVGKSKQHYVFIIPVEKELDLKKAAAAIRREKHRDDQGKGASSAYRLYPWRLFSRGDEKAVSHLHP